MSEPARLHETHISWITLIGDRAYKLLKPVETGFLDHRSRAARLRACRREVELNRRFAPDIYLGVLDVVDDRGAARDHLIEMVRLPTERRLTALATGPAGPRHVREVARAVAAIHADSPRSARIDRAGEPAHMRRLWAEGWAQVRASGSNAIEEGSLARAQRLAERFLAGREPLLRDRIAGGWIRDGHGDLLADDIYCTEDGPRILDCLAFDDRLRRGDVLMDVAFLAMDLEHLGRPERARELIGVWAEALGETHPASLAHHHIAYRAHIRAKVAAIRHAQGDLAAAQRARALHGLCLDRLERGRVRVVMVGGAPGTGKSTIAAALAETTGWPVLRTDALRDEALRPRTARASSFGEGRYGDRSRERVYDLMLERADAMLAGGESVILDASWSDGDRRAQVRRLAARVSADPVELRCTAPAEIAAARIRARGPADLSEATTEVAARMRSSFDAWEGAAIIDTDTEPGQSAAAARAVAGAA
jgi:uncharacterized protein